MRKADAAAVAARSTRIDRSERTSLQLVCLALVLSLIALACRIFSVW